jgi:hypothetical protein
MWIYIVFILIIIGLYFLTNKSELFCGNSKFNVIDCAEFKGINMLGVNSNDAYIPTVSYKQCEDICDRNKDCKGCAWYKTGQRCYIYFSGGFVPDRSEFISGMKESN